MHSLAVAVVTVSSCHIVAYRSGSWRGLGESRRCLCREQPLWCQAVSLDECGEEGGVPGREGQDLGHLDSRRKPWGKLMGFVRLKVGGSDPKAVVSYSRAGVGA